MGHDEDQNFNSGNGTINNFAAPSVQDELNRISGVVPQTQSTGGDIILNNGSKHNNKILIAVVASIFAVVIVAILLIMQPWKSLTASHVPGDYRKEFNQFANYLINGEMKEDALNGSNNHLGNYALNKAIHSSDSERKSYLEKAYKLFEDFYIDYTNENIDNNTLKARVENYRDVLKMIYLYEISDKLEDDQIVKEYMSKTEDGVKDYINNSYKELSDSDSTIGRRYAEELRELGRTYLAQLIRYNSKGCIDKNGNIDKICVNKNAEYNLDSQAYGEARRAVYNTYNSAISNMIDECWTIARIINGESDERQVI